MLKIIFKYGCIAGLIVAGLMVCNIELLQRGVTTFDSSTVVGYASMVIALSMVFMGIRSYRHTYCGGDIRFGRAFGVGILIAVVASVLYAATWEIYLVVDTKNATFIDEYTKYSLAKMHDEGATPAEIAEAEQSLAEMSELYKNPAMRMGMTFMEIFPVGLIVALISAAVLRKKEILPA